MFQSQECLLLGATLSSTGLSLVHTLHTELNMFVKSTKSDIDQKPTNIETIQKFFQLIHSRLKGKLDQENFASRLKKWKKAKGSYFRASKFFDVEQRNEFSLDDILKALKTIPLHDTAEYTSFLTVAVTTLNKDYNFFLQDTSNIGYNYNGESVNPLDQETISMMDQIFAIFDYKATGNIQVDRLFFLYLALLCCQPNPSFQVNRSTFLRDINSSFDCFLKRINCFHGRITSRQYKAYLLSNSLTSKSSLENLQKSAIFVSELGQQSNEELERNSEALFPNLLSLSIRRALPKANLSDLRKNTLDLQLLCHFLLTNFFPLIYENNHLQGLCVIKKTLLTQLFLKYLHENSAINLKTINWHFHLSQTLLTIIQSYTHLATEVLRYSLTWLLSHKNCPFQRTNSSLSPNSVQKNGFIWNKGKLSKLDKGTIKPDKEDSARNQYSSTNDTQSLKLDFKGDPANTQPSTTSIKGLTVNTKEEPEKVWQTNFLDLSPVVSKNQSPKVYEIKKKPSIGQGSDVEEVKRKNSGSRKEDKEISPSRRETSETSKVYTENFLKSHRNSMQEQSVSPATEAILDHSMETRARKLTEKKEERRNTHEEKKKWYYRDNSESNMVDIVRTTESEVVRRTITPQRHRFVISEEDIALIDQPVNVGKKEKSKLEWDEIENLRNQNKKAWKYEKVLLENITRDSRKKTPRDNSLERVKSVIQRLGVQERSKSRRGSESGESNEDHKGYVKSRGNSREEKEARPGKKQTFKK